MKIRSPIKPSSNREVRFCKDDVLVGFSVDILDNDSRISCLNSDSSLFVREYCAGNTCRLGPSRVVDGFPDKEFFTFVKRGGPRARMSDSSYLIVDVKA